MLCLEVGHVQMTKIKLRGGDSKGRPRGCYQLTFYVLGGSRLQKNKIINKYEIVVLLVIANMATMVRVSTTFFEYFRFAHPTQKLTLALLTFMEL